MPQVLAPGFEVFWCLAHGLPEANEGISEAMRIEVGQTRMGKRITENGTNGSGRAPMFPFETLDCLALGVLPSSR